MRATGIVRRVDDLGRVVIPKEIRNRMGIREGAPLEIFVDKETGGVVFIPYETGVVQKVKELAKQVEEAAEYDGHYEQGASFKRALLNIAKEMEKSEAFPY